MKANLMRNSFKFNIEAKQRLLVTAPSESEVKANPAFKQVMSIATRMVQVQHSLKSKLARFDAMERPIVRRLVAEETGLDFSALR